MEEPFLSKLFNDEVVSVTRSRRASCFCLYTSLTTFNLEPLDFQLVASSSSKYILAEPRLLGLLGYIVMVKPRLFL